MTYGVRERRTWLGLRAHVDQIAFEISESVLGVLARRCAETTDKWGAEGVVGKGYRDRGRGVALAFVKYLVGARAQLGDSVSVGGFSADVAGRRQCDSMRLALKGAAVVDVER